MLELYPSRLKIVTTKNMRNTTSLRPRLERQKRTADALKALKQERREWVEAMDSEIGFHRLFEHLSGVFFFHRFPVFFHRITQSQSAFLATFGVKVNRKTK